MPTPDDPQLPDPAPVQVTERNPESEEFWAKKKLLNTWSLLEGRFPFVSLLLVVASVVVTICAHLLPEPTQTWLYANGGETSYLTVTGSGCSGACWSVNSARFVFWVSSSGPP